MLGKKIFFVNVTFCVLLALFLRLTIALLLPGPWRPDEIFQYLEPAHKMAFGTGIVTWEWRVGIRSWLVPGFIGELMKLGDAMGITNQLRFIRIIFSFLSLQLVAVFFWYGWRRKGLYLAWLLGGAAAFWPDIACNGFRTLGEFLSGDALSIGVVFTLVCREEKNKKVSLFFAALAGFYIGSSIAIRFQIAPVAGVAILFLYQREKLSQIFWGCVFALVPVLFLGIVDCYTLGSPFQSIYKNYYYNQTLGVAATFGKQWFGYYFEQYLEFWGGASIILVLFIKNDLKNVRIPLFLSMFVVFYHSIITHKEMSFVYGFVPLFIFCSAMGYYNFIVSNKIKRNYGFFGLLGMCFLVFISTYEPFLYYKSSGVRLENYVSSKSEACGLALLAEHDGGSFVDIGAGYTGLRKNIPLFLLTNTDEVKKNEEKFNYLMTTSYGVSRPDISSVWKKIDCKPHGICLYYRSGLCPEYGDFDQFSRKLFENNR